MRPDPHDVAVGNRLAHLRAVVKLGQVEFAKVLGVSQPALLNYERGDRPLPSRSLLRIYERWGIDPLWLLRGPDSAPRPYSLDFDIAAIVKWGEALDETLELLGRDIDPRLRDRLVGYLCAQSKKAPGMPQDELISHAIAMAA